MQRRRFGSSLADFSASVFGVGGVYSNLLWAFPVGFALPFITFFMVKKFPTKSWIRQIHPVLLMYGPLM